MNNIDAVLTLIELIAAIGLLAVTYGGLLRRLATIVYPVRLKLAEAGEKYIAISKYSPERQSIAFFLDNAFNPWFMIISSVVLPILFVLRLFRQKPPSREITDKGEHLKIACMFLISSFAANPLFGTIVVIEVIVFTLPALLIAGNIALIRQTGDMLIDLASKPYRNDHRLAH